MALTKQQKATQLKDLEQKLSKASLVIFTHYIGLNVSELTSLRRKLRDSGAEMKVAKKTLMCLATKEQGLPIPGEDALPGPVACIFSFSDPVSGPQVAWEFGKDHPQIRFLGGIFEGKLLSQADVLTLATIPGKQVLLATFVGVLRSPLVSFVSICNGPLTSFARALAEVAKKKSEGSAPFLP